jgi:uncharacterized membrane protein YdbT with pleckstrin-like domain
VAFPEDVMTRDEKVVLHVHPHWKTLIRPLLLSIVVVALLVVGLIWLPGGTVTALVLGAVAVILVVAFLLRPFVIRQTTHYVFTDQRILLQQGVFHRDRRDIPLNRVNDHAMSQHFIERLLGTGTLTVESAGERGQSVLRDIPDVERVQTLLYELVEADHDKETLDADEMREIMDEQRRSEAPAAGTVRPRQEGTLGRARDGVDRRREP